MFERTDKQLAKAIIPADKIADAVAPGSGRVVPNSEFEVQTEQERHKMNIGGRIEKVQRDQDLEVRDDSNWWAKKCNASSRQLYSSSSSK